MTGKGLLLLGCGGHARSAADLALASGIAQLVFVDAAARPGERMLGFDVRAEPGPLLPGWQWLAAAGDNARREAQLRLLPREALASLVAPGAHVGPEAVLGRGVFVGHFVHVGPRAHVGEGTILNNGAIVEHDCRIGTTCHVSVHATLAGSVTLGDRVFVGAGATVIDGVSIAGDTVIGAGATVVRDIVSPGCYVGTPARRLR